MKKKIIIPLLILLGLFAFIFFYTQNDLPRLIEKIKYNGESKYGINFIQDETEFEWRFENLRGEIIETKLKGIRLSAYGVKDEVFDFIPNFLARNLFSFDGNVGAATIASTRNYKRWNLACKYFQIHGDFKKNGGLKEPPPQDSGFDIEITCGLLN